MNKILSVLLMFFALINAPSIFAVDDHSRPKGVMLAFTEHDEDAQDTKVQWQMFLRDGTPLEPTNGANRDVRVIIPEQHIQRVHTEKNPTDGHYIDVIVQASRPSALFDRPWFARHNIGQNRIQFGIRVRFNHAGAWVETNPASQIPIISNAQYYSFEEYDQRDRIDIHLRTYEATHQMWSIWFARQSGPTFPNDGFEEVDGLASNPDADMAAMMMGMGEHVH